MDIKDIRVGDLVYLRSGGPLLTVNKIDKIEETVDVTWFRDSGKIEYARLTPLVLIAEEDAPGNQTHQRT